MPWTQPCPVLLGGRIRKEATRQTFSRSSPTQPYPTPTQPNPTQPRFRNGDRCEGYGEGLRRNAGGGLVSGGVAAASIPPLPEGNNAVIITGKPPSKAAHTRFGRTRLGTTVELCQTFPKYRNVFVLMLVNKRSLYVGTYSLLFFFIMVGGPGVPTRNVAANTPPFPQKATRP